MQLQHTLGIEILETSNEDLLRLVDMSVYDNILPISCKELLITPPGFQFSASIEQARLTNGFNLVLSACDLDIQTKKCDSEFSSLPDGIYAIRYSISPNEYVKVELNHLRVTKAKNRLKKILCKLDIGTCILGDDKKEKLTQVQNIMGMLDAAKAKIEVCEDTNKGIEIYKYALKLIDKLDCKTCR